ncbi:hypothetical protein MHZ93_04640 [Roseomonas sp. ACRSG]|nr:hypothetical protein [Roseomonas sp. ACRSG]
MTIALEAAADDPLLPAGWGLRRLLMHLCDRGVRTASPLVEMGAAAAALVAELGLPEVEPVLREVTAQADRLGAAKLTLSLDGQSPVGVLDARGQSHRAPMTWRPRLRLNARFHASLMKQAVPLDRRIVTVLTAEALALDVHGWIRHLLQGQAAAQITTVAWEDLLHRFGSPGQDPAAFRAEFEDALRMVFAADSTIALAADDTGVSVGSAAAENDAATSSAEQVQSERADPTVAAAPTAEDRSAPHRVASPEAGPASLEPTSRRSEEVARPSGNRPAALERPRSPSGTISLRSHLTGLSGVIWLRRGQGDEPPVIGVTPGARLEPERLTTLLLEPVIMQVSGGLPQKEFDAASAWAMTNRDLIDLVWEGRVGSYEEVASRVKKVPTLGWRQS